MIPIDLAPECITWSAAQRVVRNEELDLAGVRFRLDRAIVERGLLERLGGGVTDLDCTLVATVTLPDGRRLEHDFRIVHPTGFPLRLGPFYQPSGVLDRRHGWRVEVVVLARDGAFAEVRAGAFDAPPNLWLDGDPAGLDPELVSLIRWCADHLDVLDRANASAAPPGTTFSVTVPELGHQLQQLTFHRTARGLYVRERSGCLVGVDHWFGPFAAIAGGGFTLR
jgi:hypothetical protein